MDMRSNICSFAIVFLSTVLAAISVERKATFNWSTTRHVYAFGDSYSFVQGSYGFPNFGFIGDRLNPSFTPHQLLMNKIIAKNVRTSSEGSNWLEYLTGCFSGLPSTCPRQLWDFAFAGADIDAALLPLHHNYTLPLVEQVAQWVNYASFVIPHPAQETLTTWWIGINDTGDTITNATITDFPSFWELEMTSYFKAVQLAYDRGLTNHLFVNVPPGERAPGSANNPIKVALQKTHIIQYNEVLARHVANFSKANIGATVISFDAHSWFNFVLDNPADFGFTDVKNFCTCVNTTGFFWYNSGHPTEHVHQLLAEAVDARLRSMNLQGFKEL